MPSSRRRRRVDIVLLAAPVALGLALASCGGDGGDEAGPALSPEAEAGREIARDAGCAGCHGADGGGGVGPEWTGLAGREVTLDDGSTVVADAAYLARAIADPGAEVVDGYAVEMPGNDLSDEEIASIVAYIEELSP